MIETVEISRDTDTVDNTEEETAEKVGTEETQNTISLSKTQTHLFNTFILGGVIYPQDMAIIHYILHLVTDILHETLDFLSGENWSFLTQAW